MTLTEQSTAYAAERTPLAGGRVELQRAFMAGALAALTTKAPSEQLMAELVQFGRAIGTAAESAEA